MRPRVARAGPLALFIGGSLIVVAPGVSDAVIADKVGWWSRSNQVGAIPGVGNLPPPPTTSPDEIVVANDATPECDADRSTEPCGGAAIAALRYVVPEGADARLTLEAAEGEKIVLPPGTGISACITTSVWDGVGYGQWSTRPTYDCQGLSAQGTVSVEESRLTPPIAGSEVVQEGDFVVWELPAVFQISPGVIDVALVPFGTPTAWSVTFRSPDDDSFALTSEAAADAGGPFGPPPGLEIRSASAPGEEPGPEPSRPVAPSSASSAAAGRAATPEPAEGLPAQAFLDDLARAAVPDSRWERMLAVVLLFGLGAAWWWIAGRPARLPRLLGSLGERRPHSVVIAAATITVGGIGRFARPRDSRPARI